jgi:hypothetical protein
MSDDVRSDFASEGERKPHKSEDTNGERWPVNRRQAPKILSGQILRNITSR